MQVVLDLAQKAEEAAATQLRDCQQALDKAHQQQQQIEQYHQEYLSGLNNKRGPVSPASMINDRQFLQQIQAVIATQQTQIKHHEQAEEQAKSQWRACWQRRSNIEQLIDRLRQEENQLNEKKLAKELDEMAAILFRSRQS